MKLRSGNINKNKKMASKNEISKNEKIKETELENKLSKNKLRGEESENREIAGNNIRKVESVEMRNKEVELGKDRRIELEVTERQHANKTGTIPKATTRSIETISRPRDKDGQSKDTLQKHNVSQCLQNVGFFDSHHVPIWEKHMQTWRVSVSAQLHAAVTSFV